MRFRIQIFSIYLIIISLSLGGLGGSFQPSRILIMLSFLLLFYKIKIQQNNKVYSIGLYTYLFTIFYGTMSLSWSMLPLEGLTSELVVMSIGMLSLPIFFLEDDNPKKYIIIKNAWIISLMIVSVLGFYEYISGNHFTGYGERMLAGEELLITTYISVFFGNYNNYNAYVVLAFPFLLWQVFDEKKPLLRILYILTTLFLIFSIFINTSKMSMALVATHIFFFITSNLKSKKTKILSLTMLVIIVALSYYMFNNEFIKDSFNYRLSNAFTSEDESTNSRLSVLYGGLEMIKNTIGLGVGAGSFEGSILNTTYYLGLVNPHNLIIELSSQYGLITFLFYLVWFFHIYKASKNNPMLSNNGKLAIKIAILTIPLVGVLNSHALGYTYWWVFFCSLALLSTYKKNNLPQKSNHFQILRH